MTIYEELLEQINTIMQEQNVKYDKKSKGYSILRVLDIWHDEVMLTKILGDLLNPQGEHNCGAYFLEKFIKRIPPLKLSTLHDLDKTETYLEYEHQINDRNRRMDIYIRNKALNIGLPIEVKIFAPDSPAQCYDYYSYASRENEICYLIYLTLDGHAPSEMSIHGDNNIRLSNSNVVTMSFNNDIRLIIEEALRENIASADLKMILRQYIECLIHCDNSNIDGENSMDKKAYEAITKNTETMQAAFELEDALFYVKRDAIANVFLEFDRQINAPFVWDKPYADIFRYPLERKGPSLDNMKKLVEEYMESKENYSLYSCYQLSGLEVYDNNQHVVFGLMLFIRDGYFHVGIYAYDLVKRDFISTNRLRKFRQLKEIFPAAVYDSRVFLYSAKIPSDYEAFCIKPFSIKARRLTDKDYVQKLVRSTLEYVKTEFLGMLDNTTKGL